MKPIQVIRLLVTATAIVVLGQRASAAPILTEQFVNLASGNLGASGTGGTGLVPGWNSPTSLITVTNGGHSLDGTVLGLVSSAGDKVIISSSSNAIASSFGCYNKFVNASNFLPTVQTNIYYSFLYRFNAGTDVPTNGTPFVQVNRQNSGFATGVHWQLQAKRTGANIQIGISKPTGTSTNYATTNLVAGQLFFVVVRQQIISGITNDIDDLWINPAPAQFGVAEGSVPTPSATTLDGVEDQSTTGPGRFWVGAPGTDANLDELRIATTWAEVTPPVGQCISAGISTDPTNVTEVAEIGATFTVAAVGTSPTFQWQVKTNGGSTFASVAGATLSTYTTPNLALATDNGNQYRCIIATPCTNLTATSAVATVTLTAPIVSPVGLVMDDVFSDQIRDNTPVTTNNSVWHTSDVAADLDAISGKLIGTTVSTKSSLWVAQFVDQSTTNLPIHLAVGRELKLTLPFTVGNFNAFTNNASLRFGLFDYADAGTNFPNGDTFSGGGSGGNGAGVRGYMLSLDFGTTFSVNSPLSLLVRNGLSDLNLMGSTGDYLSLGSGPSGGGFTNVPAFKSGSNYVLVLSVVRTDVNTTTFTATLSGVATTNLTFTATDTNLAYHRFDAFAMRDNSLETAASQFTFPEFKVEVLQPAPTVTPFNTSAAFVAPGSVVITWQSVTGATYHVATSPSLSSPVWATNGTVFTATNASTSFTNSSPTDSARFYRVVSP